MFYIKEPSTLGSPWILSNFNDEGVVAISEDTTKNLKNYHILGIDFLYQSYKKQFKGAILNEEEGMNVYLQVAAFLNAMFNYVKQQFLVLIIAPDDSLIYWHYHLTVHGGLKVQIITPHTCPADFDQGHGLALLLNFSNLKLTEHLVDYDYFSIIIDNFDEIASKLIVRRLYGNFNIGLTRRNFYTDPNQKLQWTMLNWSNPGCVGKLIDFYEIDNDNFANFRDNYRYWWFRLTWNFCESFKRLTDEEQLEYTKILTKWAHTHHLNKPHSTKTECKIKKRRKLETMQEPQENNEGEPEMKTAKKFELTIKSENDNETKNIDELVKSPKVDSGSSDDTVIYGSEELLKLERDPNYVQLPSMDENPILNSIIRNFETSPEPIAIHHPSYNFNPVNKYDLDQPTCSKVLDNDDDILLSIINETPTDPTESALDRESPISYKQEEPFSQIFTDPCTSKSLSKDDEDTELFESLIEPVNNVKAKKGGSIKKGNADNIDDILWETEVLLK